MPVCNILSHTNIATSHVLDHSQCSLGQLDAQLTKTPRAKIGAIQTLVHTDPPSSVTLRRLAAGFSELFSNPF